MGELLGRLVYPDACEASPPPSICDRSTASTVAALDAELVHVARAIKDEKRLLASLIATTGRKDAGTSIQIHAARIAMVNACLDEVRRLGLEEHALQRRRLDITAARLRGLIDELEIVPRMHSLDSVCLRVLENFCAGNVVDVSYLNQRSARLQTLLGAETPVLPLSPSLRRRSKLALSDLALQPADHLNLSI